MTVAFSLTNPIVLGRIHDLENGFLQIPANAMKKTLRSLGADAYDLALPETHYLPLVLHADEKLLGVVFGRYVHSNHKQVIGRGMLIATDKRVLLLDVKPMLTNYDEFVYDAVGGINYQRVAIAGTVVLHVAGGDIKLRTFNDTCAKTFVGAVERQLQISNQS